jgi:hypothetical protein
VVRAMNKLDVEFIVYRPAAGAGLHKAGAFGWAVNGMPIDDETSALIYFTVSFRLNTFVPLATYNVLKSAPARMHVVSG